jgi:hypothetical protein
MAGHFHERELSGNDDSLSAHPVDAGHNGKEVSVSTAVHLSEASFWRVLHLALAERPVFPGVVDEIDPDVFFSYAGALVNLIGYPFIEFLPHLNGPTADPPCPCERTHSGACGAMDAVRC